MTAAARLPGVTGGRIDEASCARRRRGHHVECPRTPQTSLGPGSASALRSAKVASWQSRRRRLGASGRAFASHGLRLAAVEGDQRTRCAAAAVLHVGCRALVKCGVDYVARTRPNVWQREASATSRTGRCALTKVGRARSKYGAASRLARPRRSDGSTLQACASLQRFYALRLGCGAAGGETRLQPKSSRRTGRSCTALHLRRPCKNYHLHPRADNRSLRAVASPCRRRCTLQAHGDTPGRAPTLTACERAL